jgi:hypothetical protein
VADALMGMPNLYTGNHTILAQSTYLVHTQKPLQATISLRKREKTAWLKIPPRRNIHPVKILCPSLTTCLSDLYSLAYGFTSYT